MPHRPGSPAQAWLRAQRAAVHAAAEPSGCRDTMAAEDRPSPSGEASRLQSEVGTHAHHPQRHFRFFEQLKQRNVFRVGALYLIVCWLILDPVHVVFHMLDVPVWADRLVVVLMAAGFPATLLFAWVYEVTPRGFKPTAEVSHSESIRAVTGRRLDRAIIVALALALGYLVVDKFWIARPPPAAQSTASAVTAPPSPAPAGTGVFAPPPHSVAVLPFVNISGDKEQEYFSDGLTEEVLNSLARVNELQVTGRTSAFYFKGKDVDIATIAHKLNVASVLEGSVRRAGHTVRVTAQLINPTTGFHLWSKTYDRDLGDVLKMQTEIAEAVATALKATLLTGTAVAAETGGTHNATAFDAYLRATKALSEAHSGQDYAAAVASYDEALRLDPNYAFAVAGRAHALTWESSWVTDPTKNRELLRKARADADRAVVLIPEAGDSHFARAWVLEHALELTEANREYERAQALAPGNAVILAFSGRFAVLMGRTEAGLDTVRRATQLDPLSRGTQSLLMVSLYAARRYSESIAAAEYVLAFDPDFPGIHHQIGLNYYQLGDIDRARSTCESASDEWRCLAVTYNRLGRRTDAEAVFAKLDAAWAHAYPYAEAEIYAQWGNAAKALDALDAAVRARDASLILLKTDPLLDPMRGDPRFQAIERALKFPNPAPES
jgi:TolB-like protein